MLSVSTFRPSDLKNVQVTGVIALIIFAFGPWASSWLKFDIICMAAPAAYLVFVMWMRIVEKAQIRLQSLEFEKNYRHHRKITLESMIEQLTHAGFFIATAAGFGIAWYFHNQESSAMFGVHLFVCARLGLEITGKAFAEQML